MTTIQCRRCQGVIPENQVTCPACEAPVSGGEAGEARPLSVFRKPDSASRPAQTPAPKATRASTSSKTPSWIYVAAAIAGLVVLLVISDIVSRAGRSQPVTTPAPTPVTTPTLEDVPRQKWAMRLSSFDEVNHVTLPTVPAGFVRGFGSRAACEDAIRPGLQRWAAKEAAKVPGSQWFWNADNPHMAGVWDGDQRRTWVRAWCVEE